MLSFNNPAAIFVTMNVIVKNKNANKYWKAFQFHFVEPVEQPWNLQTVAKKND